MEKQKQKIILDYFENEADARGVANYLANKEKIDIIIASLALEAKNGQVVMHFDANGTLKEINAGVCLYKKRGNP